MRSLATRRAVRRGTVTAVLVLTERIFAPVAAWLLVERSVVVKVVAAAVLGALFTARSLAQRVFLARTQSDLVERVATAVLDADVLQANVLRDEDLRIEATQAVYQTSQLLVQTLPGLVADAAACVALGGALAYLGPPRLIGFAAVATLLAAAALLVSRRAVGAPVERAWKVQQRVYEGLSDALDGRLEIVASGQRGSFLSKLGASATAWSDAAAWVAGATLVSGRLALVAVAGLAALALVVASHQPGALSVTLTDLAVFASVTPAFAGVAQNLYAFTRDQRWLHLVARILASARPSRPATHGVPTLPAPIAIDRLAFRYPDASRDAVSSISLTWSPNETLALAGPNGTGKSTLLRLLLALASPTSGTIRIGDVPLDALDADAWRSRVAFLPQRPYFPPRVDLRAGVRWPASDADDARILAALDRVGLTNALRREPRHDDDLLAVRVDTLSVGQRQRVALARLLCRDAAVFLLDEPDANLDRDGIFLVAELVRELAQRGMVAFAAHTPELLAAADRVITLEEVSAAHPSPRP